MTYPIFEFRRDIDSWLKFAEAKNAILVTLAGAVIQLASNGLGSSTPYTKWYSLMVIFFAVICLLICVYSFLPITRSNISRSSNEGRPDEAKTSGSFSIYYGEIAAVDWNDFQTAAVQKYNVENNEQPDLLNELVRQIYINSVITAEKMRNFKLGLFSLVCGLLTPIVGIFVVFWWYHGRPKELK